MHRTHPTRWRWLLIALPGLWAGCTSVFDTHGAPREVSRDKLLQMADAGNANHMKYMGSDRAYHYVFDSRTDKQKAYKIRSEQIKLQETFRVGEEESYVLWPWLIEGDLLGSKPD